MRNRALSQGPNLYAYVGDNPTNRVDPAGLQAVPTPPPLVCPPGTTYYPNGPVNAGNTGYNGQRGCYGYQQSAGVGVQWYAVPASTPSPAQNSKVATTPLPAESSTWAGTTHNAQQTQQIIKESREEIDSRNPVTAAAHLVATHGSRGKYDYNDNGQANDHFYVDGKWLNAEQFGNYMAGYDGAYAYGYLGQLGANFAALFPYALANAYARWLNNLSPAFIYDTTNITQGVTDEGQYIQQQNR